jgi:hypothetical protein
MSNKEYIAIALIGGSGSSFGRDPDKAKAIKICARILASDWAHLFDLHGKDWPINVYDITGHDDVYWSERGVVDKEDNFIQCLEVVTVKLSVPKQYRKNK